MSLMPLRTQVVSPPAPFTWHRWGGDVQVSACVAPADKPCQIFSATAVPAAAQRLQSVTGSTQTLPAGQRFQAVIVRVTDSATPPHPVLGASVTFQVVVSRPASAPLPVSIGGVVVTQNPAPIIISSSQISVLSDAAGLATLQPNIAAGGGALLVQGTCVAGSGILPFRLQTLAPVLQALPSTAPAVEDNPPMNVRPHPQTAPLSR